MNQFVISIKNRAHYWYNDGIYLIFLYMRTLSAIVRIIPATECGDQMVQNGPI